MRELSQVEIYDEYYRMSLVILFILELRELAEMVYGHVFPLLLLRKYAGKWGEKSMIVGSDGTSMISLHSIYYYILMFYLVT